MSYLSRAEQFKNIFPGAPGYRLKQINQALFNSRYNGWEDASNLSKKDRDLLRQHIPWLSVSPVKILTSKKHDTYKAVLKTHDNLRFETVLMRNAKGSWSVCVSSQIGCAMGCVFCATGSMGLLRSLEADEIVDQYRFWQQFLNKKTDPPVRPDNDGRRISNIVFMGMGEPLANYANLKKTLNTWLAYTDLGPTKITVSTVGVLPILNKILTDPDWPPVKIAISLHSASQERREQIVPSTSKDFIKDLSNWSRQYCLIHGNRHHHITFEYTLINEVNDTPELALDLARYMSKMSNIKINVIPLNQVPGKPYAASQQERIDRFKQIIRNRGLDITQRRTMGEDIAAACGQLVIQT